MSMSHEPEPGSPKETPQAYKAHFFSPPEKVTKAQATEFTPEELARIPSPQELQAAFGEGIGEAWKTLKRPGGRLVFQITMHRVYAFLKHFNNLLLPPLFTMLVLEWHQGKRPHVFGDMGFDTGLEAFFAIAFLSEWLIGLFLAHCKRAYICNFWLLVDLISVMPEMLGQFFRGLRGVRILRMLKFARLAKVRKLPLQLTRLLRALGVAASVILAGAIALRGIEPQTVPNMGDSLWWSLVTLSTVGYGDISPTTTLGRVVAGVTIIFGLGVFSYLTGLMATAVQDQEEEKILKDMEDIKGELLGLNVKLERIEALLEERHASPDER